MTSEQITPEPDDIDEMENFFDEKPTNRLVWIVPSILLHVVIIALWLMMPEEEPRIVKERELVIKSEQAEQLKQFVEDANLEELRMEVKRLQEIKTAINDIRVEQMTSLKEFEKEMQNSVNTDVLQVMKQIEESQNIIIKKERNVLLEMDKLDKLFTIAQPFIEKKDFAKLAPYAKQIYESRNMLKHHQEESMKQMRNLQAILDTADSVLSWLKNHEIVQKWGEYIDLQEKVMELQSEISDKQGQLRHTQNGALKKIAEKGKEYRFKVDHIATNEKKAQDNYETRKKEYKDQVTKATKTEAICKVQLKKLDNSLAKARNNQNKVKKSIPPNSKKSPEDNKKRTELKNNLKELKKEYNRLKQEKWRVSGQFKRYQKVTSSAKHNLRKLRAPRKNNNRKKLIDEMNKSIASLNDKVGEINKQKEALKLQLKALKLHQNLAVKVKKFMEAKK